MSPRRLILFYTLLFIGGSVSHDLPCAKHQTQFGAVCVCNSSYCDTVERPPPFTKGHYYRYTTSSDTPGFQRTTGRFKRAMSFKSNDGGIVFTVNPKVQYQEILGFGGSFTDSTGIVVDSLPPQAQEQFIESYFGSTGIEYTMGRVVVGMSDFSPRYYTYDDVENDDEMKHFNLAEEDLKYKIPIIQKAMRVSYNKIKLIGCSFTSPGWMKTSNGVMDGFIKEGHLHGWAKYHVKFLEGYANHSIPFWALTGGNEVIIMLILKGLLPMGTIAMPHDHIVWLRDHLAPQLAASNHSDIKFLIVDDMRPFANYWLSRFARDHSTYNRVEGVALHWYFDWFTNASLADDLHRNFPDKLIVYTESSVNTFLFGGQPVELGSWSRAGLYIYNIMENLNHWTNGYIDWNLALNTDGGPFLFMGLDAPIIVNTTGGEFYKNPMFYAIGHFSKFIPPGSRRVDVKSNQETPLVSERRNLIQLISARLSHIRGLAEGGLKKSETSSTTTAPETTTTFPFPFPLPVTAPKVISCVASLNPDSSSTVIVFNGMDSDVNVTIEDTVSGYITAILTANSLNTFVYWPNKS